MAKAKLLYVEWKDATTESMGWAKASDLNPEEALLPIISCGVLVRETKDVITLAINYSANSDSYCPFMHIPKSWIIKKKWLKS